jgi:hypothetical protein
MLCETPLNTACLPFYAPIRLAAINFFRRKYRVNFYGMKRSEVALLQGSRNALALLPYAAWKISY